MHDLSQLYTAHGAVRLGYTRVFQYESFSSVTELQSCTITLLSSVYCIHTDIAPTIWELTAELIDMNDWYSLGVALRVHPNKLQEIQKLSPLEGIQRWRIDLLQYWLNSAPNASWNDIIVALESIGHHTLSARLQHKYNLPTGTDCFILIQAMI